MAKKQFRKTKFRQGQRITVQIGPDDFAIGSIDILPYNAESSVYGVWLDKPHPEYFGGKTRLVMAHEKYILPCGKTESAT